MQTTSDSTAATLGIVAKGVDSDLPVRNLLNKAALSWGPTLRIASACLVLYWIAIFIGTHIPGPSVPKLGNDKILHLGAFGGLAFLVAWALPTREGQTLKRALITLGLIVGYAMIDELTQNFIPGRHCSLGDFIADAIGAVMGLGAYFVAKAILVRTTLGQKLITTLSR
ncbi:MAG: VanZ family protein [Pirellulales bacterium]